MTALSDSFVGQSFGKYRVEKLLGKGSMGDVYLASRAESEQQYAIKVLNAQSRSGKQKERNIRRFEREAECTAQLNHPNIVKVIETGKIENRLYLVMEYLDGKSLADIIAEKGKISLRQLFPIIRQVAKALQYAHESGIVHRDIKPANIMVFPKNQIKLMDFGLARAMDDKLGISQKGQIIGSIYYMSPEQAMGVAKVDPRADIYSLGVTIFEALTGEVPYPGRTPLQVLQQHISAPIPSIQDHLPDFPDELAAFFNKFLEKKPEERIQNAKEILEQLESYEQKYKITPKANTTRKKLPKRYLYAFTALFLIGTVIAFYYWYQYYISISTEKIAPQIAQWIQEGKYDKVRSALASINLKPENVELLIQRIKSVENLPDNEKHTCRFLHLFPPTESVTDQSSITLRGQLNSNQIFAIRMGNQLIPCQQINDQEVSFSQNISLKTGENLFDLAAISLKGEILATQQLRIYHTNQPEDHNIASAFDFTSLQTQDKASQVQSKFTGQDSIFIDLNWKSKYLTTNFFPKLLVFLIQGKQRQLIYQDEQIEYNDRHIRKELMFEKKPGRYQIRANLQLGDVVKEISTSFEVLKSSQHLVKLEIFPKQVHLLPGQKQLFEAVGYDEHNNRVIISPSWTYSGGDFKEGYYRAGQEPGTFEVKVEDRKAQLAATSLVYVGVKKNKLGWFGEILPSGIQASTKPGEYIWLKDGSIMNYIPEGDFWRGNNLGRPDEKPKKQIYLKGFYIDKFEVTWQQYQKFCQETGYNQPIPPEWGIQKKHPVVNISWKDAKAYAKWIGKTLPSEAQWEKAAKGGEKIPTLRGLPSSQFFVMNPEPMRTFPWGELSSQQQTFFFNYVATDHWKNRGLDGFTYTAPVGSFPTGASPYGVLDMAGNVWEWCEDSYEETFYVKSSSSDPVCQTKSQQKVIRGGSWYNHAQSCRTSKRLQAIKSGTFPWVGTRLVKTIDK